MGRKVFYKKTILIAMVCSFLCTFFLVRMQQKALAYSSERVSIEVDDMRFLSSTDKHIVYEDTLYTDEMLLLEVYATAVTDYQVEQDQSFSIHFENYQQLRFSFDDEVHDVLDMDGQIAGSFSLVLQNEQLYIKGIIYEPIQPNEKLVFNIPYEMQVDTSVQDQTTIDFSFDQYTKTYTIGDEIINSVVTTPMDTNTQLNGIWVSYGINEQIPPQDPATPGSEINYRIIVTCIRDGTAHIRLKDEMGLLDNTTGFGEILEDPLSSLSAGNDEIDIKMYTPGINGYQEKKAKFKDLQNGDISLTMTKNVSIEITYTLYVRNLDDIAIDGSLYAQYNREMQSSVLVEELISGVVIDSYISTNEIQILLPEPQSELLITDGNQNGVAEPNEMITFCLRSENVGEINMEQQKVEMYSDGNLKYFVDPSVVPVDIYYDGKKAERTYTVSDLYNKNFVEHLNAKQVFEAKFTLQLKSDDELKALGVSPDTIFHNYGTVGNSYVYGQLVMGGQLSIEARVEKQSLVSGNDSVIRPGDKMKYTVEVKNQGKKILSDIPLRMYFDENMEYISISDTLNENTFLSIKSNMNHTISKQLLIRLWNDADPVKLTIQPGEILTIEFVLVTPEIVTSNGYNLKKLEDAMFNRFDTSFTVESNTTYQSDVSIAMDKPNLQIELIIVDPNGNHMLEPNETYTFHFIVINNDVAKKRVPVIAYLDDLKAHANAFGKNQIMIYHYTSDDNVTTNGEYNVDALISGIDAFYLEPKDILQITFSIRFQDNTTLLDGRTLDVIAEANGVQKNEELLTYVPVPITGFDSRQSYLLWLIVCPTIVGVLYGTYKYRKWRKG